MVLGYDVTLHRDADTALWFADSNWQRKVVSKCGIKNLRIWSKIVEKESGLAQLV